MYSRNNREKSTTSASPYLLWIGSGKVKIGTHMDVGSEDTHLRAIITETIFPYPRASPLFIFIMWNGGYIQNSMKRVLLLNWATHFIHLTSASSSFSTWFVVRKRIHRSCATTPSTALKSPTPKERWRIGKRKEYKSIGWNGTMNYLPRECA